MYNSFLTAVAKHKVIDDPLYLEVLNHATMAEKRTEAFVGRKLFLKKVTAFPKSHSTHSNFFFKIKVWSFIFSDGGLPKDG